MPSILIQKLDLAAVSLADSEQTFQQKFVTFAIFEGAKNDMRQRLRGSTRLEPAAKKEKREEW